jgi:hypothetical protein
MAVFVGGGEVFVGAGVGVGGNGVLVGACVGCGTAVGTLVGAVVGVAVGVLSQAETSKAIAMSVRKNFMVEKQTR